MKHVDELIKQKIREGELDNLPGSGKPLPEDGFRNVPEEWRMSYRVLKNAGHVPPEVEKKKRIATLREELAALPPDAPDHEERAAEIRRKIAFAEMEFNMAMERMKR